MGQVKEINVNNIQMKYGVCGNGTKNLVILPGLYLKSVADQINAIETQFSRFLNDYTIYVFDRRSNSDFDYTLKQMSLDTIEVVKALGLEKMDIYGASQGGMIALYFGIYANELVNKMCVVSTAYKLDEKCRNNFENWNKLVKEGNVEKLVRAFVQNVYSQEFADNYEDAIVEAYKDTTQEEMRLFEINNRTVLTMDLEFYLNKITCPLLVLQSKGDKIFRIESIDGLVKATNCQYYYYDESKPHAVYDEDVDVLDRLERFLDE